MKHQEIERKFLVPTSPKNLSTYPHHHILQGYITTGNNGMVVRLRRKGDRYYQTVKSKGMLIRAEFEIELTQPQFETLWLATESRRLEKIRYDIPYQEALIELDVYHDDLFGLVTAEVEFSSLEASKAFEPPKWFGREVTQDQRYQNNHLALYGLPQPQ